jgi:hypothetical protein
MEEVKGYGKAIQITNETIDKIMEEVRSMYKYYQLVGGGEVKFRNYLASKAEDPNDTWYFSVWYHEYEDEKLPTMDVLFHDLFWNRFDEMEYEVDTLNFFDIEKLV